MKTIYGQRWDFVIGNTLVNVDNAYDTSGWGKERLIVNGETVQDSAGRNRSYQAYEEPWLTYDGEVQFAVKLKSNLFHVYCQAWVGDEPVACQSYYEAVWSGGEESWPESGQWIKKKNIPQEVISPRNYISEALNRLKVWKK